MYRLWIWGMLLIAVFCSCRVERMPERVDNVMFDFEMVEKGIEWLEFINAGADDRAVKEYFMAQVAPTGGCRSIIHHWERFMKWDDEEFYSFIMEALGRVPSDSLTHDEKGALTMFGRRQELWKGALSDTGTIRRNLDALRNADFERSISEAKRYLPAGVVLEANFYIVLFGHSNAYSVGEENGFDLLQLPRNDDGTLDIEEVIRTFTHELHHTGFDSCQRHFMPEIELAENILLLGLLAAEGMPTYFIDAPYMQSRMNDEGYRAAHIMEIEDWERHFARIEELYREAEQDIALNLEGSLSQQDILEKWMSGVKGPAYILGADMVSVVDRYLGTEKAVSIAKDYRKFLEIYNSAAEAGIREGADLFLFGEDLARKLTEHR